MRKGDEELNNKLYITSIILGPLVVLDIVSTYLALTLNPYAREGNLIVARLIEQLGIEYGLAVAFIFMFVMLGTLYILAYTTKTKLVKKIFLGYFIVNIALRFPFVVNNFSIAFGG